MRAIGFHYRWDARLQQYAHVSGIALLTEGKATISAQTSAAAMPRSAERPINPSRFPAHLSKSPSLPISNA